jgi:hemolysin activation/secretion protein
MLVRPGSAQDSASKIQRTQDMLEQEKILRKKLEELQKIYIKEIAISGVTLLNDQEINTIISPFVKHWLTQEDLELIDELFMRAYAAKRQPEMPPKITYMFEDEKLIITVTE